MPRLVDRILARLVARDEGVPAVLVVGPRGSGKTTTATRHARSVFRLDRPGERAAMAADPDAVLASATPPVLLDEWQLLPEVLGAVKRAVDEDFSGGRFLLTGSARADLTTGGWAGTGRVVRLRQWGMTQRELAGCGDGPSILTTMLDPDAEPPLVTDGPDVRWYVGQALRGGLPQVARTTSAPRRTLLLDAYVDQLVTRDVELLGTRRAPIALRRYLRAVAASTAGTPATERLMEAAGVDRGTALAYDDVLEALSVTEQVPAFVDNRLNRLMRRPKRYVTEPSLLVPLLGIDERVVLRDGDLLGRLIDTYVAAQLRPELELIVPRPQLLHLRDANGEHEVDLVLELADGTLVAIEVKAAVAPGPASAKHLRWLRDRVGDRFRRGIVLHTGPRSFTTPDGIWYLPVAACWAATDPVAR